MFLHVLDLKIAEFNVGQIPNACAERRIVCWGSEDE